MFVYKHAKAIEYVKKYPTFLTEIQNLRANSSIILRVLECDIFRVLFFYEHRHIGRFPNLH